MTPAVGLVIAKAPVPGHVKTRLAASVGAESAARLAAAALLDTMAAYEAVFERCFLALAGDLTASVDAAAITARAQTWTLLDQRGSNLSQRLANAHADVAALAGTAVVQVGMDTPQVQPAQLVRVVEKLRSNAAVLGPAEDGGWWVLGFRDATAGQALADVPMSTGMTGALTVAALDRAGSTVTPAATLRDVDTSGDAAVVAAGAPNTRFAAAWRATTSPLKAAR